MNTNCKMIYASPLGEMLLLADGEGLRGAWFVDQAKYYASYLPLIQEAKLLDDPCVFNAPDTDELPAVSVLKNARKWLDQYFSGVEPTAAVPLHLQGTDFQQEVWTLLQAIPYGTTVTYGDLAKRLASKRGCARMAAQAVGGAVGRNPVSIIVPCHRVIGSSGSLTGYAGGIERKAALLKLEGVEVAKEAI